MRSQAVLLARERTQDPMTREAQEPQIARGLIAEIAQQQSVSWHPNWLNQLTSDEIPFYS
jgi:hypothetical protein